MTLQKIRGQRPLAPLNFQFIKLYRFILRHAWIGDFALLLDGWWIQLFSYNKCRAYRYHLLIYWRVLKTKVPCSSLLGDSELIFLNASENEPWIYTFPCWSLRWYEWVLVCQRGRTPDHKSFLRSEPETGKVWAHQLWYWTHFGRVFCSLDYIDQLRQ